MSKHSASKTIEIIDSLISQRSNRRKLRVNRDTIRYSNNYIFAPSGSSEETVLVVGIGHGHDTLVALADNYAARIVGVDPYFSAQGNDDADYLALTGTATRLNFGNRLVVEKMIIEEYLAETQQTFDRIVCNDVLHHIFESTQRLSEVKSGDLAIKLFAQLRAVCRPGGTLVICEVGRWGLRQVLGRSGILGGNVDYRSKQGWRVWRSLARTAGWDPISIRTYVPYPLRKYRAAFSGATGRWLACDRYVLHLRQLASA